MKKSILFLLLVLSGVLGINAQGTMPEFSTTGDTVWYYIRFKAGGHCLKDPATTGNAALVTADKASEDGQKWALVGTKDNFKLVSKKGNYIAFSSSRFRSNKTTGVAFHLVNGSACWELQRNGAGGCMNQWGGTGVGVQLGEYTAGDNNNGLNFVEAQARLPKFSTAEQEYWYFLSFSRNNNSVSDNGAGQNATLAAADPVDGQMWKFVGTPEKFQLVSKAGNYAYINGTGNAARLRTRANTEYAGGFSLVETTNSTYAPAWEIKANAVSGANAYFNQWEGPNVGNQIGLYALGDPNNPITFISPDKMTYDDYKVSGVASFTPENPLTLWYDKPATLTGVSYKWMEYSLPIGNGQLGASIFGGVATDEIQFNEKTLWTGGPNDMGGYGAYKNFGSVLVKNMSADFDYSSSHMVKNYVRYLDIETATAGVRFTDADESTIYTREYISSTNDKVIAVCYKAEGDKKLDLLFSYAPGDGINAPTPTYSGATASFGAKLTTVTYNTTFKVLGDAGAQITTTADGIRISNTGEVVLLLAGLTDYDPNKASCNGLYPDVAAEAAGRIAAAEQKGWDKIYADHVATFQSYMGRVRLQLGDAATSLPTNLLVDNYNNTSKNVTGTEPDVLFLEQLYFAYGRYLEISSSLGIDVPNNLQGIWNDRANAPWNSDIHSNINIQMNYWPAEPTNLSEAHMPFLNYIINMAGRANWKRAATTYGKVKNGWTCFTENNIFGGMSTWGNNYFVANVWYCQHLWQHYRYTLDKDFLRRAFPAMYSAAQFWFERMINDRGYSSLGIQPDGTLVAPNEYSPEQNSHSSEDGTAHAQQLIYYNLKAVREAIDILGKESGVTDREIAKLDEFLEKTDQGLHTEIYTADTGSNGAWTNPRNGVKKGDEILREWKYSPYTVSDDPNHRHLSHLMALYPLDQISSDSKYFQPAVNSLKLRGDAATGWSMGWKVNLWARALDGDHAHLIIHNALRHSTAYTTDQYSGGVYYNLYDSHAPFQIDGNFGVCAGMAEMLLQSHTGTIQILPALPKVWKSGSVSGLKTVGDFEVAINWENGKASQITIKSNQGQPLIVSYPGIGNRMITKNDVEISSTVISNDVISIPLIAGETAVIDMNNEATAVNYVSKKSEKVSAKVNGNRITINGCDVAKVVAIDTLGNMLKVADCKSFTVSVPATKVMMLVITDSKGNSYVKKIKM